jgi:hypothetical protein
MTVTVVVVPTPLGLPAVAPLPRMEALSVLLLLLRRPTGAPLPQTVVLPLLPLSPQTVVLPLLPLSSRLRRPTVVLLLSPAALSSLPLLLVLALSSLPRLPMLTLSSLPLLCRPPVPMSLRTVALSSRLLALPRLQVVSRSPTLELSLAARRCAP